jgi:hypothetical protein
LKNALDIYIICAIIESRKQLRLGVRELAPAFPFRAAILGFASPKLPKSLPLESIDYEMQILQLLSFDIHANWWG